MGRRRPVAPGLWAWLRVAGSLSAQLASACGPFAVRVLSQGLAGPRHDEVRALQLAPGTAVHQRSVCLLGAGQPLVLARSVTGQGASRGAWRALRGLGSQPLARLLFDRREVRRCRLQWDWYPPVHPQARRLARVWHQQPGGGPAPRGVWSRRAVFLRRGQALQLCEYFAPARVATWPRPQRGRQRVGRYSRSE